MIGTGESNEMWNDRSMTGMSQSYFKPTTQDQKMSMLDVEPAMHQLLG